MDKLTKGTWIINSNKHLLGIKGDSTELVEFESTQLAGKAGNLLSRMVAEKSEIIEIKKVKAFASMSGIRASEIKECLDCLQREGKVDYTIDTDGKPKDVEIYSFSVQDALKTTSDILDSLEKTKYEEANLLLLDKTFKLPRSKDDLLEFLTKNGLTEKEANNSIILEETLQLIKTSDGNTSDEKIYYNEHTFADDSIKIFNALKSLPDNFRVQAEEIQNTVDMFPGFPRDELCRRYDTKVVNMMEGVGLLNGVAVKSSNVEAVFMSGPQLKGISIDQIPLSLDVFHKAKILLSCLRFGQIKSDGWRGRIDTDEKLFNIINKLNRKEWIGPCLAIGEDYKLLELDGVIKTRPSNRYSSTTYEMKLRQPEVGILVKQMFQYSKVNYHVDQIDKTMLIQEPLLSYDIPENRRKKILAKQTKPIEDIKNQLLQTIRMGVKSK